jgi:SnoaL-like domain
VTESSRGPWPGRDAVLRHVAQLREAWDRDTAEPIGDLIHTGDRVVARFIWHGAGQGPEANMSLTCVYTVREGKIHWREERRPGIQVAGVNAFEFFRDHGEALKAAGLRE